MSSSSKQTKITSFFQKSPLPPTTANGREGSSATTTPGQQRRQSRQLSEPSKREEEVEEVEHIVISVSSSSEDDDDDEDTTPCPSVQETPAKRGKESSAKPQAEEADHDNAGGDEKVEDCIIGMRIRTPVRHSG